MLNSKAIHRLKVPLELAYLCLNYRGNCLPSISLQTWGTVCLAPNHRPRVRADPQSIANVPEKATFQRVLSVTGDVGQDGSVRRVGVTWLNARTQEQPQNIILHQQAHSRPFAGLQCWHCTRFADGHARGAYSMVVCNRLLDVHCPHCCLSDPRMLPNTGKNSISASTAT